MSPALKISELKLSRIMYGRTKAVYTLTRQGETNETRFLLLKRSRHDFNGVSPDPDRPERTDLDGLNLFLGDPPVDGLDVQGEVFRDFIRPKQFLFW